MDEGKAAGVETEVAHQRLPPSWDVAKLHLRLSDGSDRSVELTQQITLGSAEAADICLSHPTVSRLHARIEPRGDGPWIVDIASTNGVCVDGVRVGSAKLHGGAIIRLGDLEVHVLESTAAKVDLWPAERFGPLLGRSEPMRALFEYIQKVAASDAAVLIQGETGTGKDVVANAIHDNSPRRSGPFVVFDCGSVPEPLFESELFGHVRGAFTGADRNRAGALESAEGGTLFLDEVGELPAAVQPKLLRMLETRTYRRVGESRYREANVRVVAATHRDISRMAADGSFREDLYFRLMVLPVYVPPLRERLVDLPLLAQHFAGERELPAGTLQAAAGRSWPGNVRELRTFVERALVIGPDAQIPGLVTPVATDSVAADSTGTVDLDSPLRQAKDLAALRVERAYLAGWIERTGRNVTAIAGEIGLDRTYVHRLLKKHEL
jgi:transcriptional regulator with GAF, ATPase, and Fis domain